jgi:hypothetical protein
MFPVLFAAVIFGIASRVFAWAGLDCNPIYVSQIAEMTGMS